MPNTDVSCAARPQPLAYHDYALLLTLLDAEWTRSPTTALQAFDDAKSAYESACTNYRDQLEVNHRPKWAVGRVKAGLDDGGSVDPVLFKAATWLPCGHADLLCAVLIDDLDAAQTIVELYPKTVEEVTLAFCPKIESDSPNLVAPSWFTQNKDLSGVQTDHPLLAVIRLKLEGLLTMGRALRVQNALFRLIAKRVEWLCSDESSLDTEGLFDMAELRSIRVALVDLQDEEEIGLLVACSNYSAAMAVSAHLQNLTIDDLATSDPLLAKEWEHCLEDVDDPAALKEVIQSGADHRTTVLDLVRGSHLLRWTRTTVAYGYAIFEACCSRPAEIKSVKASGFIKAMVGLHIPPGHRREAEKILEEAANTLSLLSPPPPAASFQTMGTLDLVVTGATVPGTSELESAGKTVHCLDLLKMFGAVVRAFNGPSQAPRGGRHISGWTSTIQVPVPSKLHSELRDDHRFVIGRVLTHITNSLFPERLSPQSDPNVPSNVFSLAAVRAHTRNCGFPVALRRSLMFLYENLGTILANPRLFEVVLDFADFLAGLNTMIVDVIPTELGVKDPHPSVSRELLIRARVERPQVEDLALVLDALSTSLDLRLRRVYPEQDTRDWSIDFRSSLSQILSAGEACLKSAAGFVRKYGLVKTGDSEPSVSVTTRLSMSPGIRATPIQLAARHSHLSESAMGTRLRNDRPRLAVFDADVFHFTDLRSFIHFFHESFHLIYSDPVRPISDFLADFGDSIYDLPRLSEEVYVQLLMWLTVFDEDEDLMLIDFCYFWSTTLEDVAPVERDLSFGNKTVKSGGERGSRDLHSFAENFATIAIAILCGRCARNIALGKKIDRPSRQQAPPLNMPATGMPSLDELAKFVDVCLRVSDPMLENRELCSAESKKTIVEVVARIYDGLFQNLPTLWVEANQVYQRFVQDVATSFVPSNSADNSWTVYRRERSVIDSHYMKPLMEPKQEPAAYRPWSGCQLHPEIGQAVDGTLLVLSLLHNYLRFVYQWSEQDPKSGTLERVLLRPYDDDLARSKKPTFLEDRCYSNFLLDPSAILPFSCSPRARRHRLGVDTCVIKMLWDVTSRQRRRRLRQLLSACSSITNQTGNLQ